MVRFDWNKFKVVNRDYQKAFEELCYHLFCRKFKLFEGITTYHNQPGIESEPIKIKSKYCGFQAKFFEHNINSSQIEKSIKTALRTYPNLKLIYIYLNTKPGRNNQYQAKINLIGQTKKCEIKWVMPSQIESQLLENLDLAETYFQIGGIEGFLGNCLDKKQVSQVKANEYLDLSYKSSSKLKRYSDLKKATSGSKIICLKGGAGSGKSLLMTKLSLDLQPNLNQISRKMIIPVFIKLRNCHSRNLDEYIFFIKQKYNIQTSNSYDYIYLFDGLDELNEEKCEEILNDLYGLRGEKSTKCIIISSRESSSNLILLEKIMGKITHFKINPLNYKDIKKYFNKKAVLEKKNLLKQYDSNSLKNISDTLLLNLFWREIENVNPDNLDVILFEKNIESILSDKDHISNLTKLNLLNPKDVKIISANREISWYMSNKSLFSISLGEVQKITSGLHPKLLYTDLNNIINYNTTCFFTNSQDNLQYNHRRYQEFFYLLKLQSELETDFSVLRKSHILINFEFMRTLFFPYLKKYYFESGDITNYLRIKSLESYFIDHWSGEGGEYLIDRIDEIAEFLANMNKEEFNFQISVDNPLMIKNIIENMNNLTYDVITVFYIKGKKEYADYLLQKIKDQIKTLEVNNSEGNGDYRKRDLFKKKNKMTWHNHFRISIYRDTPLSKLLDEIRKKEKRFESNSTIYNDFFSAVFDLKKDCLLEVFNHLEDKEIHIFLEVLARIRYIHLLFDSVELKTKVQDYLDKDVSINESDILILFYHSLLNVPINNISTIKPKLEEKINKIKEERSMIINRYSNHLVNYCRLSFILNRTYGDDYLDILDAYSSLFANHMKLLNNEITLRKLIYDFNNLSMIDSRYQAYFKKEMSNIIGECFLFSKKEDNLVILRNTLFNNEHLDKFTFYLYVFERDKACAKSIIDENDLHQISIMINEYDDYNDILENNLKLANLYLLFDFNIAITNFKLGLSNSLIRYGWRKDYFLNYLVDSLQLLIDNNYFGQKEIYQISDKILSLSSEVLKHIDGKGTKWAPYELIKNISDFDIAMAEQLLSDYLDIVFKDDVLCYILANKAKASYSFEEIQDQLVEIRPRYLYQGEIDKSYHIYRFKVFFELAKNESYGDEKQSEFFQKAFNEIGKLDKDPSASHYEKADLEDSLEEYKSLCKKYGKKNNLQIQKEKTKNERDKEIGVKKENIIKKLKGSKKSNFKDIFEEITKHTHIISDEDCLHLLIEKSLKINNDIELILEYLESRWYAKLYPYDENSKYDFLLVKQIFNNPRAKRLFLKRSINSDRLISYPALLKIFALLNNKKLTRRTFYDYLYFCDFLIN